MGSSGAQGGSGVQYESPWDSQSFYASPQGQQYKSQDGLWIKSADGGYTTATTDGFSMIDAYRAWSEAQNKQNSDRKDYINMVNQQQGRDQTILTGPGASGTLLTR